MRNRPVSKLLLFASPGRVASESLGILIQKGWKAAVSFRRGGSSEAEALRLAAKYEGSVVAVGAELSTARAAGEFCQAALDAFGAPAERLALVNVASRYPEVADFARWERTGSIEEGDWEYFSSNFEVMRCVSMHVLELGAVSLAGRRIDIVSFVDARSQRYFDEKLLHPFAPLRCIDFNSRSVREPGIEHLRQRGVSKRDCNPYLLSKLLIAHATRELALEHPESRINAVAPGVMSASPGMSAEKAVELARQVSVTGEVPGHRLAADTIFFLLEMSSNMTGSILHSDGGMHLKWLELNS